MENVKTLLLVVKYIRAANNRLVLIPFKSPVTKCFSTNMTTNISYPNRQRQNRFKGGLFNEQLKKLETGHCFTTNISYPNRQRQNIFKGGLFNEQLKKLETGHCLLCSNRSDNETGIDISEKHSEIEHQLIGFMEGWEIEKAVALLRNSVKIGILPKQYLVLNLLQLIGNLGDYKCLLSLREILMDNRLCSNEQFFGCLQEAYYNSGRLDEAVLLLRILYHDVRKYEEIDIFFTLIGVMFLVHFPHRFYMMESFAKDCRDKEPEDFLPTAGLWKCLMLTENFEKAQSLVTDHEEVQKYLPKMMGEILSYKNKVQINRLNVLKHFVKSSADYKTSIQGLIYTELVSELVKERRWKELLFYLMEMEENQTQFANVKKIEYQIMNAEDILFNEELDNFILMQCIDKLKTLCDDLKKS